MTKGDTTSSLAYTHVYVISRYVGLGGGNVGSLTSNSYGEANAINICKRYVNGYSRRIC